MLWFGGALLFGGVLLAARATWAARRGCVTGTHGLLIAVGAGSAVWGAVLLGLAASSS
ncbi:hypothetical protein [Isoptericola sp. AK164]|uniref:hypothetical protein n=1 Tax=Isoptericola sp. AK164 TaxID=3024246 RepID=UPI0024188A6B|nr:hypothetical protein [Isoptericola sp. AK164]